MQIRRPEHLADGAILRILELDLVRRLLVAAEVHDLRGGRGGPAEADADEVALEEARAARDVRLRVLGAVLDVVVLVQDVAGVVEERDDEADLRAMRSDRFGRRHARSWPAMSRAIASVMSSVCWMS